MFDVITIGSSLVDIYIKSDAFLIKKGNEPLICQVYGSKQRISDMNIFVGGGGTNTAVAYARLGLKTGIISETGKDLFSKLILEYLITQDVDTTLIVKEKFEQTGVSIILIGRDGQRTILTFRGASGSLDPYDIPLYWLSKTSFIHITNLDGRLETLDKIFTFLNKKEFNTKLIWNPGKKELKAIASKKIDFDHINPFIFFSNKEEWDMLKDVYQDILVNSKIVVITNGDKGGTVFYRGKKYKTYKPIKVKVKDTTGAGDSFASAFSAALIKGLTIDEAIEWGKLNSASVVRHFGAKNGLLTVSKINELMTNLRKL